jgi:hypothetical protein
MRAFSSKSCAARRLLACATVALAILQAVALLGSTARLSGTLAAGLSAGELCAAARDADGAPIAHHSGEHHCVLCPDKDAPPAAVEPAAALLSLRRTVTGGLGARVFSPRAPPLGFASAWSSRAPPLS